MSLHDAQPLIAATRPDVEHIPTAYEKLVASTTGAEAREAIAQLEGAAGQLIRDCADMRRRLDNPHRMTA